MADYWILEKQYVHKLFKVLVPRFQYYKGSYTNMVNGPKKYPAPTIKRLNLPITILELRGNPYPPLPNASNIFKNKNLIHNVLLDAAKKDFYFQKYGTEIKKIEGKESEVD